MHNLKIKGFTLMELLVTISVVAIIVSLAVPSFIDTIERRHLEGAASSIHLGLQRAKSEAVKKNEPVTFDITTGVNWCYGLVDDSDNDGLANSCNCANADCTIDGQVVTVAGSEFDNVVISSSNGTDVTFDKTVGLPNATPTYTATLGSNTRTISVNAAGLITTN